MNAADRELLDEKFRGLTTLMNAQFIAVNDNLSGINQHLKDLNGKVAEHEKELNTIGEDRIKACVQKNIIQEIRDGMVSRKAVYGAVFTGIGTISALVGIAYGVAKLAGWA